MLILDTKTWTDADKFNKDHYCIGEEITNHYWKNLYFFHWESNIYKDIVEKS